MLRDRYDPMDLFELIPVNQPQSTISWTMSSILLVNAT